MAGVALLVYDGDCGFCTRSASWVVRRSPDLRVVPWQAADVAAIGLTTEQCQEAVQLVRDGTAHSGGRAIAKALQECHQPYRAVGVVLDVPLLRPLVSRVYDAVARHRHRLPGGTPACASHGDERHGTGAVGQGTGLTVAPADR